LCVRPERVMAEAGAAGPLSGALLGAIFQGDHARLRFALDSGVGAPEIVVKRPAGDGMGGLVPGRSAALAWEPRHGRIFLPEP